ncbi:MAG: hypothetical protein WBB22_09325 [Anaerolineae bacterium]
MRRNRPRQSNWWLQPWAILALLGAILIVAGLGLTVAGRAQSAALEARLAGLEDGAEIASSRLALAREEYEANHALYADHWSAGLEEALNVAGRSIGQEGEVFTLLYEARQVQDRDRQKAYDLADRAESLLSTATSAVDAVLGPADAEGEGLYETLARKGNQAQERVAQAGSEIAETRANLDAKAAEAWNRTHGLSFSSAYAKLTAAESQLGLAQETLVTVVHRGLVDLPLAFDQAEEARGLARSAAELAETDEANARSAWASVEDARSKIQSANVYIADSNYRQAQAIAALTIAEATLRQAEQAFGAEEFSAASRYAEQVLSQAEEAWLIGATPAPEAPATWSPDSGSDSDSWDTDGSDSDSWDSDTDSWDDGGSDSDSWDDSGSDSDSW